MLGMHLKRISKWEIWVWICFQHFIQGNFCWWTTTVCLWRVTPSKLFRRRPKSGGNCKYTTFPGTHAPNRSGQQESFRRGETRPQFHCLVHLLPAYWTPALPALLEFVILEIFIWKFVFWNVLSGNFSHFRMGAPWLGVKFSAWKPSN